MSLSKNYERTIINQINECGKRNQLRPGTRKSDYILGPSKEEHVCLSGVS